MADISDVVSVVKWYETQAGVAALTAGVFAVAEGVALWKLFTFFVTNFRNDIKEAFKQAKDCADQRHADAMLGQAALGENTKMLAVISEQLKPDRRSGGR